MKPLIIGVGNSERGDDGVGLLVARRLRQIGHDAREHSGEMLSLLEKWQGYAEVVLIDAVITGAAPGTVNQWDGLAAPFEPGVFRCSTHNFGIAEVIRLGRKLNRLPGRLVIYGVEAARFEVGSEPSVEVLAAVETAALRIAGDLSR